MPLFSPVNLSDADKLNLLRRLDQFRQWRSLDEKRYCLVCAKIITGRQIQVAGGTRGNGTLRISCPSDRCNSIPMDWVLPTGEIIAKAQMMLAEEREVAELASRNQINGGPGLPHNGHDSIGARLRTFVFNFKRRS